MHLSRRGRRGHRQSWPQTGLLTGTSSSTTGTRACCSSGSEGLQRRKEGRAMVLVFSSAPKSRPRPLGPATSQEGFRGCLQGVSLLDGWGGPPGRTKETNLRPRGLRSAHWAEVSTWKGVGHRSPHLVRPHFLHLPDRGDDDAHLKGLKWRMKVGKTQTIRRWA